MFCIVGYAIYNHLFAFFRPHSLIGVNPPAFCGVTPHFRQNLVKTPYFTIAPTG